MTPRATLHALVDKVPEENLAAVERVLTAFREPLGVSEPSGGWSVLEAPADDEPDDDDYDGELTKAREEARRGETIPHWEAMRRLGSGDPARPQPR